MVEKLQYWLTLLDLKSGVIMSIWTLSIIAMSWLSVIKNQGVPASVITLYGMGLGAFAVNKTVRSVTTEETK